MSYVGSGGPGTDMGSEAQQRNNTLIAMTGTTMMVQTIGGAAAIVLTILGLAHLNPVMMAAIATVSVSVALALQGLTASSCYSHVARQAGEGPLMSDIRTGLTAEFIAGTVASVLGVLALLGIDPITLTAVAVTVMGTGLLLGAGIHNRLAQVSGGCGQVHPLLQNINSDVVAAAAGAEVMVGGGSIVLGVLSLVGTGSATLVLVGLLALGGSTLLNSTAMAGRMGGVWARR